MYPDPSVSRAQCGVGSVQDQWKLYAEGNDADDARGLSSD